MSVFKDSCALSDSDRDSLHHLGYKDTENLVTGLRSAAGRAIRSHRGSLICESDLAQSINIDEPSYELISSLSDDRGERL